MVVQALQQFRVCMIQAIGVDDTLHLTPCSPPPRPPRPVVPASLLPAPSRHLDHAGVVDALMPRLLGLLRSGTGLVSFASLLELPLLSFQRIQC